MSDRKTISVDATTYERLQELKAEGQSWDGLLNELCASPGRQPADADLEAALSDDSHRALVEDIGSEVEARLQTVLENAMR